MDGPSRTVNPAWVRPCRAPASKGLGKISSWVQALPQDTAAKQPRHTLLEKPTQKYRCMSKPTSHISWSTQMAQTQRAKQGGRIVHKDSRAHRVTTSSLTMKVEAVTLAIQWLTSQQDTQITHSIILTDSMNLLQMVKSGMGCPNWYTAMHSLRLQRLLWIYWPQHAGVSGNWQADRLASTADITSALQVGREEVHRGLRNFLNRDRPEAEHHTPDCLKWREEVWRASERKRPTFLPPRSETISVRPNIGTVSTATLGKLLREREGGGGAGACMGLSERYDAIFSWNWNWNSDPYQFDFNWRCPSIQWILQEFFDDTVYWCNNLGAAK